LPNGKGSLDCSYCSYFAGGDGYPEGFGEQHLCRFHAQILPPANNGNSNRICGNFEPNAGYLRDNRYPQFFTLARRFAWFGINMEPGTLYQFQYNYPPGITELSVLRLPDYHNDGWKGVGE
jgi:hypothetical protein